MGPPGSGKTFFGKRLAELGMARYVELEPILVERFGTGASFLANKGAALAFIAESHEAALAESGLPVAIESTGVSDRPLLEKLGARYRLLVVKVLAPKALCMERVASRARDRNLSNDVEATARFHDFWHAKIEPSYAFACAVDGTDLDAAVRTLGALLRGGG